MSIGFGNRTLGVRIDTESATIAGGFGVYPLSLHLALTPQSFENECSRGIDVDVYRHARER